MKWIYGKFKMLFKRKTFIYNEKLFIEICIVDKEPPHYIVNLKNKSGDFYNLNHFDTKNEAEHFYKYFLDFLKN